MSLFDDTARTSEEPRTHTESPYHFLNRSAWPASQRVRDEMQSWLDNVPEEEQAELSNRMRSEFPAAFFELLLHEVLVRSGFDITFHPTLRDTTHKPDFLAVRGSSTFYLEAVVATDATEEEKVEKVVRDALYEEINRVESPDFFLGVVTVNIPKGVQPATRRLKAFLKRHLESVDPDTITEAIRARGLDGSPIWRFEDGEVVVAVQPIPKSPEIRGKSGRRNIGMYPIQSRWGGVASTLRNVIRRKASRYGRPDQPFVIAVNSISEWGTEQIEIMEALFGTEQLTFAGGRPEPSRHRAPDGAFFGPSGPQNTRVSGVIVGTVSPWTLAQAPAVLYHNPWCGHPLPADVLPFPQAVPREGKMARLEGTCIVDLLGLRSDWPQDGGNAEPAAEPDK